MGASAGNEMIAIPPGQVALSDRRTQRTWSVELAPYQLAAFPITHARYVQVTGQRPSTAQGDQLPVEGVSWWEAVRFCDARSQREGLAPAYRLLGARADSVDRARLKAWPVRQCPMPTHCPPEIHADLQDVALQVRQEFANQLDPAQVDECLDRVAAKLDHTKVRSISATAVGDRVL
jgi:hypothetical protein